MKHHLRLLTISIFLFSVQFSFGQVTSSNEKKKKPYIVWVKLLDNTPTFKGYLSEVGDTLVIISLKVNTLTRKIRLDNVNYLKFNEKGNAGRSASLGGVVGFGFGALVGYVTTPSDSSYFGPGANAIAGGLLGIIPGLLIGGIIGSKKIQVPIQGSNKSVQAQKEELRKYKFGG